MEPLDFASDGGDEFDDGSRARRARAQAGAAVPPVERGDESTDGGRARRAQSSGDAPLQPQRGEFAPRATPTNTARPVQSSKPEPVPAPVKGRGRLVANTGKPNAGGNVSSGRPGAPGPSPKGRPRRAWEREFMPDKPQAGRPGAKPAAGKPAAGGGVAVRPVGALDKPAAGKPGAKPAAGKPAAGGGVAVRPVGVLDRPGQGGAGGGVLTIKPDSVTVTAVDPASDAEQTQALPGPAEKTTVLPKWLPLAAAAAGVAVVALALAGQGDWTIGPNLFVRELAGDWVVEVVRTSDASVRERWTVERFAAAIASGEFVDPEGRPAELLQSLRNLQASNPPPAQRAEEAAKAQAQAAQLAADNAQADAQAPSNVSFLSDLRDSAGDLASGVGSGAATGLKVAAGIGAVTLIGATVLAVRGRK